MFNILRAVQRVLVCSIGEYRYRRLERQEFRAAEHRMSRARLMHQAPFRVDSSPRRVCLFAHFDRDDQLDPHVVSLLNGLVLAGIDIVFVSACRSLPESDLLTLQSLCARVVLRDNVGLDFGSWKEGLRWIGALSDWDELILANDSAYGPMWPLADVFQRMSERPADIWGITDSLQVSRHLQSYFLVFRQRALESPMFAQFWNDFRPLADKWCLIRNYEIGLSVRARRAGLRLEALCDSERPGSRWRFPWQARGSTWASQSLNPVHQFWRELLLEVRSPFLKVQLLRDNPLFVSTVNEWRDAVSSIGGYDPELISNHLDRMNRRATSTTRPDAAKLETEDSGLPGGLGPHHGPESTTDAACRQFVRM